MTGDAAGPAPAAEREPLVILIGPMGVGKSAVGRLLAQRLGVAFADGDEVVVDREGRVISDIFIDQGEPYFRAVEREVTLELLSTHTGVLALGGGAPMQEEVGAALAGRDRCQRAEVVGGDGAGCGHRGIPTFGSTVSGKAVRNWPGSAG